jgi:hypothetical protein
MARTRAADALGDEPETAEAVAAKCGLHPGATKRLFAALASLGYLTHTADGRFAHTAASKLLRENTPGSLRGMAEGLFGHDNYEAWGAIEHSLRTGETGFLARFGRPKFEHHLDHPESARIFAEAMSAGTRMVEAAVLADHDFGAFAHVIDVGGSQGALVRRLLEARPNSRATVFDLPVTIETGKAAARGRAGFERVDWVGGDFFKAVPGGGDLYILKLILHDWADEECLVILRRIRKAIPGHGRLAVIETVLPDSPAPHHGFLGDINMLVQTGGRERTAAEFDALLSQTGFRLTGVNPTNSPMSVLEAAPI